MIKTTAPDNTLLVQARVIPSEIGFLNALVEEYEGLAHMRTLDRRSGVLKFWTPRSQWDLLQSVFDDFIARGWMLSYERIEPWWEIRTDQAPNPS
ncbi:MAG: DUF4911 domain-containing protein [Candidatus Omnitrophica bacterium]|nr:DUF4911 domain-containing protein [Candidatus Omnitrophota bacterium]